jgi:hypothetical protein
MSHASPILTSGWVRGGAVTKILQGDFVQGVIITKPKSGSKYQIQIQPSALGLKVDVETIIRFGFE